jgi:hypothetical protein
MNISKRSATTLGEILADTLHACTNCEQRAGVLRMRDALEDALLGQGSVNWDAYRLMQKRFNARLDEIEPLYSRSR